MRTFYNLNHKWAFSKSVDGIPHEMPVDWNLVRLPHTWNDIDGQDGGNDFYRGTCCYVKEVDIEELPDSKQYYLELQGANSSADIYLNGQNLAHHDGGYSTWRVNITNALQKNNIFVIMVDNSENDTVYPQHADFTFYGGLYRDVRIIGVEDSHFDLEYYGGPGIKVTPTAQGSVFRVETEVFLANSSSEQKLRFELKNMEGLTVEERYVSAGETKVVFMIENPHLWNGRKDPYLYYVEVSLLEEEKLLDQVTARFGCRYYEIDPERGFILNGKEYPLRGVSRHQDRWGSGNALLPEHHKEDMELICELGANTIRLAHYQHSQYFYDLCDERGMVVWAEIPYISKHMVKGRNNTISQMKELIVQNYNHPSIVVWGLSNEITMNGSDSYDDLLENHKILNNLAHEMDATRKTTLAVLSSCGIDDSYLRIPDTIAYNHYFGWYGGEIDEYGKWFDEFHKKYPDQPIGCSEYGCEALNWHTSSPEPGDYTEEYQAYYHEKLIRQLFSRKYIWATYVWNMFDFGADSRNEGGECGQNHKGLVTFDRKYKKDAFYAYKAWLSMEPFVHICGKRYRDRVEDVTKVTVYSNQPEVELFANESSLGKQSSEDHFFYFDVPNHSVTTLHAVAGDCEDVSIIRKVDEFNEEYRLKEKNVILNWFDITEKDGYYSLNDKLSNLMKSEEAVRMLMDKMGKFLFDIMGMGSKDIIRDENGDFSKETFDKMLVMMKEVNNYTVLRLVGFSGFSEEVMTKEKLLEINAEMNKIKKA